MGRTAPVELLPTVAAVDRINELLRLGAVGWAGALHLTCGGVGAAGAGEIGGF
jgi:hypothetical protein